MTISDRLFLVACLELLGRVPADRLQHPEARSVLRVAPADKALVEKRLEEVGIGVGDLLGGLVGAAAGEDGEATDGGCEHRVAESQPLTLERQQAGLECFLDAFLRSGRAQQRRRRPGERRRIQDRLPRGWAQRRESCLDGRADAVR